MENSVLAKKYNVKNFVKKESRKYRFFQKAFMNGCYYYTENPPVIELYWDVLVSHYKTHWKKKDYVWIGVIVKLLESFSHEMLHCLEDFVPISFKFEGEVRINGEGLPY